MLSFTSSQLPLATANGSFSAAQLLVAALSASKPAVLPALAERKAYKSREFVSQSAHRAQVLAGRRATIRTSAKRW